MPNADYCFILIRLLSHGVEVRLGKYLLTLVIIFSFTGPLFGGNSGTSFNDTSRFIAVIDLIAREEYDRSLQIADSQIFSHPDQPAGYLLKATILNSRAVDFEDNLDDEACEEACNKVVELTDYYIEGGDNSPIWKYYAAMAWSYRMYRHSRNGNWIKALNYGINAGKSFEQAVSLDSTLWDAYLGLGTYYYYRSSRAGLLRNIGLVSDRRKQGIEMVRIASVRGSLSKLPARSSLAWIELEMSNYDSAIEITETLLNEYPGSRSFLWCLGRAQLQTEKWQGAVDTYHELLSSIRAQSRNNHYNEVGCLHALAKGYAGLKNWHEVVRVADEALGIDLNPEIAIRKTDDLTRLKKLRKRGLKFIESANKNTGK